MNYAPRFTAVCPSCHREIDQGRFRSHALRQFLDENALRFHCRECNLEWQPSEQELIHVEYLVKRPLFLAYGQSMAGGKGRRA
jgi:hypothetical protein